MQKMGQVFCLGGHIAWPRDSEDANLTIKSVLGNRMDFQRDKVGDTDPNTLFVHFFCLCDILMFAFPWGLREYEGSEG